MAIHSWPADIKVGPVDFGIEYNVQINVFRNGKIVTYGLPGGRWVAAVTFENEVETMKRPKIEAMIVGLEGGANLLAMPFWGRRIPNGSMRGSPTINANAVSGAKQVSIVSSGTLLAGDVIGILGQNVMVMADAVPVSGVLTVDIKPALRRAVNPGTAVVWNSPTVNYIPRSRVAGPFPYRQASFRPGFSIELVEAF